MSTTSGTNVDAGLGEVVTGRRRYEIVRKLGAGGMAEVYLCTMFAGHGFARPVALKIIRSEYADRKSFAEQFAQEARFASMLSHPSIIDVLDFDRDLRGRLFLAMEYIEGVDLHALTVGRAMPPSLAIHVATEVLRGLGYAHELPHGGNVRGIVHRDVSPQNVLLSWHGAVKVADFGIAKALTTSGVLSGFKGKAAYMSPEQAMGDPIDARSDLFSLGVVLWEMLTARRLFQGGKAQEVIARIMFGDIAPPSTVRPVASDLESVVMKLLAKERDARYPTARAAIADLLSCRDVPRNGPGELVSFLAKRYPSGSQYAQPAPKGTAAGGTAATESLFSTNPDTDHASSETEADGSDSDAPGALAEQVKWPGRTEPAMPRSIAGSRSEAVQARAPSVRQAPRRVPNIELWLAAFVLAVFVFVALLLTMRGGPP